MPCPFHRNLGCYGCQEQAIGSVVQQLGNFTALQTIDFSNQLLTGACSSMKSD